jgi:hypothetical protein
MKLSELTEGDRLVNRLTVPICMSSDALNAFALAKTKADDARKKLERAQRAEAGRMDAPLTVEARAELEQAEAELAAAEDEAERFLVDFRFESIGADAWDDLLDAHQSPDEQKAKLGDQDPGFDAKTFPVAAVTACLVEPEVDSPGDVVKLRSKLPSKAWDQLFAAAVNVNRSENRIPPMWLGSRTTPSSVSGSEQHTT